VKARLWGGPHDGQDVDIDQVGAEQEGEDWRRLLLPDPTVAGRKVVYEMTNQIKSRRRIYRIVRGPGC